MLQLYVPIYQTLEILKLLLVDHLALGMINLERELVDLLLCLY